MLKNFSSTFSGTKLPHGDHLSHESRPTVGTHLVPLYSRSAWPHLFPLFILRCSTHNLQPTQSTSPLFSSSSNRWRILPSSSFSSSSRRLAPPELRRRIPSSLSKNWRGKPSHLTTGLAFYMHRFLNAFVDRRHSWFDESLLRLHLAAVKIIAMSSLGRFL